MRVGRELEKVREVSADVERDWGVYEFKGEAEGEESEGERQKKR